MSPPPPRSGIGHQVEAVLVGAWLVAHNARVEVELLTRELPGFAPAGAVDTLRLARVLWPGRPSYGLDALIRQERLDLSAVAKSRRHRAAYATAVLLLRLLDNRAGRRDEPSAPGRAGTVPPTRVQRRGGWRRWWAA